MKILFITHYYEPDSGAAAVRLTRLAKMLAGRGHQVTVLTTMPHYPAGRIAPTYRGRISTDEDRDGVRVVQVWLWATPSRSIALRLISQISFMLMGFMRGVWLPKPDAIFIENQPIFTGLMGWAISKIKRTPYLLNVSDFWPEHLLALGVMKQEALPYRVFKALVNRTQRDAHTIVTLFDALYESIQARIGDVKRQQTIMNATDLTRLRPQAETGDFRARFGLDDRPIISFIGTFQANMDYATFFEVLGHYRTRDDVQCVLVGGGGEEAIVQSYLQQEAWSHIRHVGWLDFESTRQAWALSYITFWTVNDNLVGRQQLNGKLYEAHASGVPIVVCVEGLLADLLALSGGGVAVPFGDVQGACQAIDAYLADPALRQTHSHNARAYAEAHFDPVRVTDAYERLLRVIAEDA